MGFYFKKSEITEAFSLNILFNFMNFRLASYKRIVDYGYGFSIVNFGLNLEIGKRGLCLTWDGR